MTNNTASSESLPWLSESRTLFKGELVMKQDSFGRHMLTDFFEKMNDLITTPPMAGEASEYELAAKRKKKKKSGGGSLADIGSLFRFYSREGVKGKYGAKGGQKPSIVGISHPSDGHPQEELAPDFGWFRPLSHNNMTWVLWWPELTV